MTSTGKVEEEMNNISALQQQLYKEGSARNLCLHLIGSLQEAPSLLRSGLPPAKPAVVVDATTEALAGLDIARALHASLIRVPTRADGTVVAGRQEADWLQQQLAKVGAASAIAVGAGVLNDLTKYASHQLNIPCAVVATAPSMNGYTSAGAALLDSGIKTSVPCQAPRIVVAPLDVLAQAPARMIAAGFGDLCSRPVSGADWYLGHRLLATPYNSDALRLVDSADDITRDISTGLAQRSPESIARLTAGLLLSGMAMDIAGTSAPSSGCEHLISHHLDMFHFACGGNHDLHGCQVGVATIAMSRLYERFVATDIAAIEAPTQEPWEDLAERLAQHFGLLWDAVEPVARQVYELQTNGAERRAALHGQWQQIQTQVRRILGAEPGDSQQLALAGGPVRFREIGIVPAQAREAMLLARYVRARYTLLDLLAELGVLEVWIDDMLAAGDL